MRPPWPRAKEQDLALYRSQRRELNELLDASDRAIRHARATLLVWSRTHRALSHGVTDPARIDLSQLMEDLAKRALSEF